MSGGQDDAQQQIDASPPRNKCPGCGIDCGWMTNCGRYRCVETYGFPRVAHFNQPKPPGDSPGSQSVSK